MGTLRFDDAPDDNARAYTFAFGDQTASSGPARTRAEWFHYLRPDDNLAEGERYEGHIGDVDAFYLDFGLRPDGTYKSIGYATLANFEFGTDLLISLNDKAGHYRVVTTIEVEGGHTFYNLYNKKTDTFVASLGSIAYEFDTLPPPVFDLVA